MQNKQNLNHFYSDTGLDSLAFSDVIDTWYSDSVIDTWVRLFLF